MADFALRSSAENDYHLYRAVGFRYKWNRLWVEKGQPEFTRFTLTRGSVTSGSVRSSHGSGP